MRSGDSQAWRVDESGVMVISSERLRARARSAWLRKLNPEEYADDRTRHPRHSRAWGRAWGRASQSGPRTNFP